MAIWNTIDCKIRQIEICKENVYLKIQLIAIVWLIKKKNR